VLVEGRLCGRTRCNRLVFFQAARADRGRLLPVRLTRATAHTLYGEIVDQSWRVHETDLEVRSTGRAQAS
jgi:tRNA A37 methylthiotransferase MiaB